MNTLKFVAPDNTYATRTLATVSEMRLMPDLATVKRDGTQWLLTFSWQAEQDEIMLEEVRAHALDHGLRELKS